MTTPEPCPDAELHGAPYRYCPTCNWREAPCGAPSPAGDACHLYPGHPGQHQATVAWGPEA
jgi:hypothetical protein